MTAPITAIQLAECGDHLNELVRNLDVETLRSFLEWFGVKDEARDSGLARDLLVNAVLEFRETNQTYLQKHGRGSGQMDSTIPSQGQGLPFSQIASHGVSTATTTTTTSTSASISIGTGGNIYSSSPHHGQSTPIRLQDGSIINVNAPAPNPLNQERSYPLRNQNVPDLPPPNYQWPPLNYSTIPHYPNPWNMGFQYPGPFYSTQNPNQFDRHDYGHGQMNLNTYDRVRSWNVKFSGTQNENVESFLKKIATCQQACNMRDEDLFRVLPVMLGGIASNWWEDRQERYTTFEEFKHAIIKRFSCPQDVKCRLVADIVVRTQGELETGGDYLDNVRIMWRQSRDTNFPVAARLDIAFTNLRPEYHTMISRDQFHSFDQLEELVLDFDNRRKRAPLRPPPSADETIYPTCAYVPSLYSKVTKKNNNRSSHEVNVVENKTTSFNKKKAGTGGPKKPVTNKRNSAPSVAQSSSNQKTPLKKSSSNKSTPPKVVNPDVICFKCGQKGHAFPACTSKSEELFCWGCGEKGIKKPDCSKCGRRGRKSSTPPSQESENANREQ